MHILFLLLALSISPIKGEVNDNSENNIFLPLISNQNSPAWHWGEISMVPLAPTPRNTPISVIDAYGRVHIFWDTYSFSGEAFIYHVYQKVDGWSQPVRIAETLGSSSVLGPPVLGPDGRIHLIWNNSLYTSGPIRLMHAAYDGFTWSEETELARSENLTNFKASINLDIAGNPLVAYTISSMFFRPKYFYAAQLSGSWQETRSLTAPFLDNVTCEVYPDTVGGVHFYCYSRNDNSKLSYAYWKDGEMQIPEQPFIGALRNRSSLLDSGSNLHTYWTATVPVPGGSVTGLHHRCLFPDLSWGEERVISGQEQAGTYRVSWDGEDRLVFGWKAYAKPLVWCFWMDVR
jgi:hypothetical protein